MLFKRIKDWATSIAEFRTGDVIPVDGPSGTAKITFSNLTAWVHKKWASFVHACTAITSFTSGDTFSVSNPTDGTRKMFKDTLLTLTAQNALAGNVAPAFDSTKPNDEGGYAYYAGTNVTYEGKTYVFAVNHSSGAWNPVEVEQKPLSESINIEGVGKAVAAWLDEHPEATTTVEDRSLTEEKFSDALKLQTIKDYVTPEMFGAKGDGVTDDFVPMQHALNSGKPVNLVGKTYLVGGNGNFVIAHDFTMYNGTIKIPSASEAVRIVFESFSSNPVGTYVIDNVVFESTKDQTCVDTFAPSDTLCSNIWLFHLNYAKKVTLTNCIFKDIDYVFKIDTPLSFSAIGCKCTGTLQWLQMFGTELYLENVIIQQDEEANSLYHCVYEHGSEDEVSNDTLVNCILTGNSYPYHGFGNRTRSRKLRMDNVTIKAKTVCFINDSDNSVTNLNNCSFESSVLFQYTTTKIVIKNSDIKVDFICILNNLSGEVEMIDCTYTGSLYADNLNYLKMVGCRIIGPIVWRYTQHKLICIDCIIDAGNVQGNHVNIRDAGIAYFVKCTFFSKDLTFYNPSLTGICKIVGCVLFTNSVGINSWIAADNNSAVYPSIY